MRDPDRWSVDADAPDGAARLIAALSRPSSMSDRERAGSASYAQRLEAERARRGRGGWWVAAALATAAAGLLWVAVSEPPARPSASIAPEPSDRAPAGGPADELGDPSGPRAPRARQRPAPAPRPAEGVARRDSLNSRPVPDSTDEPAADPGPPGRIRISSRPWSHVFLDGEDTGRQTPVVDLHATPGPHVLELMTSDGAVHTHRVQVRPGELSRVILTLDAEQALEPLADDEAMLVVNAIPWAQIYVDGLDSGEQTPARLHLEPGEHTVELYMRGGNIERETVSLVAGETRRLARVRPRPAP